jgi:hypothetical protein
MASILCLWSDTDIGYWNYITHHVMTLYRFAGTGTAPWAHDAQDSEVSQFFRLLFYSLRWVQLLMSHVCSLPPSPPSPLTRRRSRWTATLQPLSTSHSNHNHDRTTSTTMGSTGRRLNAHLRLEPLLLFYIYFFITNLFFLAYWMF